VGPFGIRQDLFGFIDVVVLDPQRGIGAIQSTGSTFGEHINRILDSEVTEFVLEWLKSGGFVEVWGWRRVKVKRGGKALRWAPRVREITLKNLEGGKENASK